MKKIVKYFLQGLLLLSPLIGTAYIFGLVFSVIDNSANDIILDFFDRKIKGLGFILTLSVITVFGFLSSTILFRGIFIWIENLLLKSTVVRLIYTSIKDLSNAFVGENKKFNKPVLVNLQKDSGIYKLGFITQESMSLIDQKELIAVYLPMSYSFAGDLFLVEKEYIKAIDINNVEAMKFVVSGGVTHLDKIHTSNHEDSNDKISD
jgi:uncharacterized membrane protein